MSLRIITDTKRIADWMQERGGTPARLTNGEHGWTVKFSDVNADLVSASWEDFIQALKDERLVMLVDDERGRTFYRIYPHR